MLPSDIVMAKKIYDLMLPTWLKLEQKHPFNWTRSVYFSCWMSSYQMVRSYKNGSNSSGKEIMTHLIG
jgi:hypothetical protein